MKYSRYNKFIVDGTYKVVPFIKIPERPTDYFVFYEVGKTRLDLLSYQYYNDPNFGWLILQANPNCSSLEFLIEDNERIRIPYPLEAAIQGYEDEIEKYDKLYGLN